jgi:endonuclease III
MPAWKANPANKELVKALRKNRPDAGVYSWDRTARLYKVFDALGEPFVHVPWHPWEQILWENCAYLVDDSWREGQLEALSRQIGLDPKKILRARRDRLRRVLSFTGTRILDQRVDKIRTCAELCLRDFGGDVLGTVMPLAPQAALKALMKFPGIGVPGAERILLFMGHDIYVPMDSNAMRLALRLGYGTPKKSYDATYRVVQEALKREARPTHRWLTELWEKLRYHGQEVCTRTPRCEECVLWNLCPWYKARWGRKEPEVFRWARKMIARDEKHPPPPPAPPPPPEPAPAPLKGKRKGKGKGKRERAPFTPF